MNNSTYTTPEEVFNDKNYKHYVIKYNGNTKDIVTKNNAIYVTPVNDRYAILTVSKDIYKNLGIPVINDLIVEDKNKKIPSIVYIAIPQFFTLQSISPIDASQVRVVQINDSLGLTGNGTMVGIIDTGIDYLSEEFMDSNGKSRIDTIWDQTINSNNNISRVVPYGTVYGKDKIDQAISLYREGGNPYDIVPSIDELGHGTNMSGIIGASGKRLDLKGVAPNCEFAVVKLNEDIGFKSEFNIKVPLYNISSIFMAIQYLVEYSIASNKPVVIYLPLGSTFGNHKGKGILSEYIGSILNNIGIVVVSGSGNEGEEGGHASGIIPSEGSTDSFTLDVSEEQKFIRLGVWVDRPDIMTIEIISPSGESTGVVPVVVNSTENYTFIFEQTRIIVSYSIPAQISGDELILVYFFNLRQGRWKIRLKSKQFNKGSYNAWIPQKGITVGDTKLIPSDPFGTITIPGDSKHVITVAAYNQNNNNIVDYSGVSLRNIILDQIDVAAGGESALTVAPNNEVVVVSGTSVSAAVVAGVCLLLFQWGIVDRYNPYMYSETVRSYLIRGTFKREGDIYPNPEWGYGILNVFGIFENMK